MPTTRCFITTVQPRSTTLSRQRSHIIPGPYFGYWNSSISDVMSFWLRFGISAFTTALNSDRFLMRCAAKSAGMLVDRHAPQLLVVGLEEVFVEPPAEARDDPALERVWSFGGWMRAQT